MTAIRESVSFYERVKVGIMNMKDFCNVDQVVFDLKF
jgi:hypothetical protein